jgi:1-acyl-sn-glycerol-3-phosphate acyltransferase
MSSLEIVGMILVAVVVTAATFVALLPWLIRPMLRLVLATRYGFRVRGSENIPRKGPAVVVSNHVTWIDGLFLCASAPRRGRILANAGFFKNPVLSFIARRIGVIPVPFSGPKAQRAAITAVREALRRGEVVAIMPEGQLTRTGFLGPFYRGLEVILKGFDDVPVVPAALDNLWGSIWSFHGGRTVRKRPVGLRRTVAIAFGEPLTGPPSLFRIRLAILEANVDARELRGQGPLPLEAIDLSLPHLDHPELGLLAASTADYDQAGVTQAGQRPGTVGLPPPGVALRVVDEVGRVQPEDSCGRLLARVSAHSCWTDTGSRGKLDRDGFLTLV